MATPLTRAEWLDECAKLAKTYEEAMTDEAKALVYRMRNLQVLEYPHDRIRCADLIETQAREIERLNAILSELNDTDVIARTMAENERLRGLVSSYRLQIDQLHDRAALAGDSHDQ